jgi:hypothetical protein
VFLTTSLTGKTTLETSEEDVKLRSRRVCLRRRDFYTGKSLQVYANILDGKLHEDIDRMKKIRLHKGA